MKILLTGSEGFVGSQLQLRLKREGHEVICLDRINLDKKKSNYLNVDLSKKLKKNDFNILKAKSIDFVIHLAAAKGDFRLSDKDFYRDNVLATKKLVGLLEKLNITKVIHYSTVSVYGHNNQVKNEKADLLPNNPYGLTKLESEKLLKEWYFENPEIRNLTVLRPSVIYGVNNFANMYNLMSQLNKKYPIMIGSGNYVKSMIGLNNLIEITLFCLKDINGIEIYNCTDEPYPKLKDVIGIISTVEGFNKPVIKLPYFLAYLFAIPFEILSFVTKKDFGITLNRLYKLKMPTDYRSHYIKSRGYVQKHSTKDNLIQMANWFLRFKNEK